MVKTGAAVVLIEGVVLTGLEDVAGVDVGLSATMVVFNPPVESGITVN